MNGTGTDPARPVAVLRLPPAAQSAGAARRFLRGLLAESGRERWTDAAELALSEVVTNGVLHAHTDLVLRVHLAEDAVEVEVQDANPTLPTQRRSAGADEEEATTGRGLGLVAALTRDCGVRAEAQGKVVWFVVGDEPAPTALDEDALLAAWDVDDAWAGEAPAEPTREVVLRGLPPTLWMAVREHHQALLRELVLYLAEHPHDTAPLDLALADEARALVWTALLEAVEQARDDGSAVDPLPEGHPSVLPVVPATVDLLLQVPERLGVAFGVLQDALDTAERLAVADLLLARPGLPEVVAVRDWACEQVVAQLSDVAPSPWPGADQERFTSLVHDREVPEPPDWDASVVLGSERGVVAADDANRIIAVSPALAATTGWDAAELVGRRVVALIPPSLREAHVAGFTRHLSTGQAHVLGVDLQLPVLRRDGSEVLCHFLVERAEVVSGRPVYLAWISPVEG